MPASVSDSIGSANPFSPIVHFGFNGCAAPTRLGVVESYEYWLETDMDRWWVLSWAFGAGSDMAGEGGVIEGRRGAGNKTGDHVNGVAKLGPLLGVSASRRLMASGDSLLVPGPPSPRMAMRVSSGIGTSDSEG